MNESESSIEDDLLEEDDEDEANEDGSDSTSNEKVLINSNESDESEIVDDMSSTDWKHIKMENSGSEESGGD